MLLLLRTVQTPPSCSRRKSGRGRRTQLKRLGKSAIPKKSKLGTFSSTPFTSCFHYFITASANIEFSEIVRCIGALAASSASSLKAKGGFEIYADPTDDPDIREIIFVVRKWPRRVGGGGWWCG